MVDIPDAGPTNEQLFVHLVMMFQIAAMQQLGKVMNPLTNKIERDLEQAKFSIDTISMLKEKTKGNLSPSEEEYLGKILFELQMNYVDEVDRAKKEETASEGTAAEEEKSAGEAGGEEEAGQEKAARERAKSAGEPAEGKSARPKSADQKSGPQNPSAKKGKGVKGSAKGKKKPKSG